MKVVRKLLPHATIILANMFVVFFILDRFNPAMNFIGHTISKWLLLLFALCAIVSSIFSIADTRRAERARARKAEREARAEFSYAPEPEQLLHR